MPELPEVETTRRGVAPYCRGQVVQELVVRESRLRWPVPPQLGGLIANQTIQEVERRAERAGHHL